MNMKHFEKKIIYIILIIGFKVTPLHEQIVGLLRLVK